MQLAEARRMAIVGGVLGFAVGLAAFLLIPRDPPPPNEFGGPLNPTWDAGIPLALLCTVGGLLLGAAIGAAIGNARGNRWRREAGDR